MNLLHDNTVPDIVHIFSKDRREITNLQDGAQSHFRFNVRLYLDKISSRSSVDRTARSPNLSTLDFSSGMVLKSNVYKEKGM